MKLFVIDSADVQTALFDFLTQKYAKKAESLIWIDGVREKDGKWYYIGDGKKTPAFSGLLWIKGSNKDKNCLMASNRQGNFKVEAALCKYVKDLVCEYKK